MAKLDNKFLKRILIAVIVLGVAAYLIFNPNGFIKFMKMKSELNNLDERIRKSEDTLKILQAEIDSLQTSKAKIEKVAREKFHMIKKNEKAFKIEEN